MQTLQLWTKDTAGTQGGQAEVGRMTQTAADHARNQAISKFWDKYLHALEQRGVVANSRRWYVRHCEQYIAAHEGVKLASHTAATVERYLREISTLDRMDGWRIAQAIHAIRISHFRFQIVDFRFEKCGRQKTRQGHPNNGP